METLHIITACSRFVLLQDLAFNFFNRLSKQRQQEFLIRWHIAFQNDRQPDPHGCVKFNEMIDLIPDDDWIWILDDDNLIHLNFFPMLQICFEYHGTESTQPKRAFVFSQNRRDALGPVLKSGAEKMKPGGVDTAQVVFKKSLMGLLRFPEDNAMADGVFYQKLWNQGPREDFLFMPDAVTNFNGGNTLRNV